MSGWDEGNVYYTDQNAAFNDEERLLTRHEATKRFMEFLRTFRGAPEPGNPVGTLIYRDQLEQDPPPVSLTVSLDDIIDHDDDLARNVKINPQDYIPALEDAAADVILAIRAEKQNGDAPQRPEVQVLLSSQGEERSMRSLASNDVSRLVRVPGIVIAAARPKPKATRLWLMCKSCKGTKTVGCAPGFGGAFLPRTCDLQQQSGNVSMQPNCGVDPFVIIPEKSTYLDMQTLKLQENPEAVPPGEMPRNMMLVVERSLVQQIVPGTRVSVMGIFSIYQGNQQKGGRGDAKGAVAIRQPYIRVVGIEKTADSQAHKPQFTDEEVRTFKAFSQRPFPELVNKIRGMIAPSIFGSDDMKVAIATLLFGGSRKRLPDGARLRGDINVLMLGDPSTAKSQFLKFVEKTAPIAVYTSGKGSSAAGLTASVIRDASGDFYLEGGAMVLADGGVVCIDEFDKMRPEDRVAIHEAMEQQTISIAKAGITTVLNSRTAVLAAANPPSGRYDDLKTAQENIELQSTILSRFDLIFLVKDERSYEKDLQIAKHVTNVHKNSADEQQDDPERARAEAFLKRYIEYARAACRPRLDEPAMLRLQREYVGIRAENSKRAAGDSGISAVPITVRQLEAIIRVSEALAKMTLQSVATAVHVEEAVRLFNVSTMDAARSGVTEGINIPADVRKELAAVEERIRQRLPLSGHVSRKALHDELARSNITPWAVDRAIVLMIQRRELEDTREGKCVRRLQRVV